MVNVYSYKTCGNTLNFGRYKGKTIEQLCFEDYQYIDWARRLENRQWIGEYLLDLPVIFPRKIKILCGQNHHAKS